MMQTLYTSILFGLASFSFVYAYKTFPLFQKIRKFVKKNIHIKLAECTLCISFWFSLFLAFISNRTMIFGSGLLSFDFVLALIYILIVALASATVSYFLANVVYYLSGDKN